MTIPKSVNVLGKKYKVAIDNKKLSNKNAYGEACFDDGTIVISEDLGHEERFRTYMHELGHCIINRSGISFSGGLSGELEEIIVECYANVLTDIFYKKQKKLK